MLFIFNLSIQDSTPYSIILSVSPSITTARSNEACFDKPAQIGFFKLRNHILWISLQQNIILLLLLCPRFSKREIIVLWVNQKISFICRLSLVIPDYRGRKGRSSLYSRGGQCSDSPVAQSKLSAASATPSDMTSAFCTSSWARLLMKPLPPDKVAHSFWPQVLQRVCDVYLFISDPNPDDVCIKTLIRSFHLVRLR